MDEMQQEANDLRNDNSANVLHGFSEK